MQMRWMALPPQKTSWKCGSTMWWAYPLWTISNLYPVVNSCVQTTLKWAALKAWIYTAWISIHHAISIRKINVEITWALSHCDSIGASLLSLQTNWSTITFNHWLLSQSNEWSLCKKRCLQIVPGEWSSVFPGKQRETKPMQRELATWQYFLLR